MACQHPPSPTTRTTCAIGAAYSVSVHHDHANVNVPSESRRVCGLGQDVSVVERGVHLVDDYSSFLLCVTNVVVLDLYVLGPAVMNRVSNKVNRALVVLKDLRRFVFWLL